MRTVLSLSCAEWASCSKAQRKSFERTHFLHRRAPHLAGAAKVKDCLEEHRNDEGFGSQCREEVNKMIEERVHDFRLDSRLRKTCEADIYNMCAFLGEVENMDLENESVVRCLQVCHRSAQGRVSQ